MECLPTLRVFVDPGTSAVAGTVEWAPVRSIWASTMTVAALSLAPFNTTPQAVLLFLAVTAITLCLGHSLGLHRLLIHRSFSTSVLVERTLVYLGTLVGMAGPLGMVRLHDTRDWAQRQRACHDFHAHRAGMARDAWRQMHCRLVLAHPPRLLLEPALERDPFLHWLEATWMLQQLPLALVFYCLGGMPWLVWGIPVRIAVSLTGHWFVGYLTHLRGPQTWSVDGVAVQGHDLPQAALITFGEAWHGNHHAWPDSARLGIEPGQHDPGWWVLLTLSHFGVVWNLKEPRHLVPRPGLQRVMGPSRPQGSTRKDSSESAQRALYGRQQNGQLIDLAEGHAASRSAADAGHPRCRLAHAGPHPMTQRNECFCRVCPNCVKPLQNRLDTRPSNVLPGQGGGWRGWRRP